MLGGGPLEVMANMLEAWVGGVVVFGEVQSVGRVRHGIPGGVDYLSSKLVADGIEGEGLLRIGEVPWGIGRSRLHLLQLNVWNYAVEELLLLLPQRSHFCAHTHGNDGQGRRAQE